MSPFHKKKMGMWMRKLVLGVFLTALVMPCVAQLSPKDQGVASSSAGLTAVGMDFRFDGSAPSEVVFAFDEMAYGLFYNRQSLVLAYVRGSQTIADDDKLTLTDFSLSGWLPFRFFETPKESEIDVFFPVGLESNYRRIKRTKQGVEIDAFEYTVLAAGTGLGASSAMLNGVMSARGLAYYGIASRSFGFDTDTSAILRLDVDWTSGLVTDRFGVSVGYGYRWQKWYSDMGDLTGDDFDFVGKQHSVRLGISF